MPIRLMKALSQERKEDQSDENPNTTPEDISVV